MNCPKCGSPFDEGALYCENCECQVAVINQKAKVAALKSDVKGVIAARLGSVVFLIMTICFTAMLVGQVITMFIGSIGSFFGGILPFVFMLITALEMWKCYLRGKKGVLDAGAVKNISMFDAYSRVCCTVNIVISIILAVVGSIVIFNGASALGEALGSEDSTSYGGVVAVLIYVAIMAVSTGLIFCYRVIYANRRSYFKELSQTALTGEYKIDKARVFGSWILGIFAILSLLGVFATGVLVDLVIDMLAEATSGMEGTDKIINPIKTMLDGLTVSFAISGFTYFANGIYYILCAIWMYFLHKTETSNAAAVEYETVYLAELEVATRRALEQRKADKYRAEQERIRALEAVRIAAELEARRAAEREAQEAATKEQEQAMTQMVQQMVTKTTAVSSDAITDDQATEVFSEHEEEPVATE